MARIISSKSVMRVGGSVHWDSRRSIPYFNVLLLHWRDSMANLWLQAQVTRPLAKILQNVYDFILNWHIMTGRTPTHSQDYQPQAIWVKSECTSFWICARFAEICGHFVEICGRFALWFLHEKTSKPSQLFSFCHFYPMSKALHILCKHPPSIQGGPSSFHTVLVNVVFNLGYGLVSILVP